MKGYNGWLLTFFFFPMFSYAEPISQIPTPQLPAPQVSTPAVAAPTVSEPVASPASTNNSSTLQSMVNSIKAIDFSEWTKYGSSLQTCTAGTFRLPNPIILGMLSMMLEEAVKSGKSAQFPAISAEEFKKDVESTYMTYQIMGWNDDKCEVKLILESPAQNKESEANVSLNCAFPKDKLAIVAKSANNLATNSFSLSTDDPSSKVMDEYCKETK